MMRIALLAFAIAACGGGLAGDPPGDPPPDVNPGVLPGWELEDVQPLSPRSGQTYGLDTFSGQIVVVTLLSGF